MIWTKERCKEESLKYDKRSIFKKEKNSAYNSCLRNGWLDELCFHMEKKTVHVANYWTKERCQEESLKYLTRSEFQKKSKSCYMRSLKNGWLDEICKHMTKATNNSKRCIYAYEFENNSVYVGLTNDIKVRNNRHLSDKNDVIYQNINKDINYTLKILTDYINTNEAKIKENDFLIKYTKDNWIILNKGKTGSLGSNLIYWTKERCQEESLKYKNRSNFYKNSSGCYHSARKNGWLDEICSHMNKDYK